MSFKISNHRPKSLRMWTFDPADAGKCYGVALLSYKSVYQDIV